MPTALRLEFAVRLYSCKKVMLGTMSNNQPHLTKSRYISGLRCSRKLWLDVKDPGPFSEAAPGSALDIGNQVGKGAHFLFPGGVIIEAKPWEHEVAVIQTRRLMSDGKTPAIFEAAFEYDGTRIRVDGYRIVAGAEREP